MRARHPHPFAQTWRASWIWAGTPAIHAETATRPVLTEPVDKVVLLRRSFLVTDDIQSAPCRFWADGRAIVRVNGVEVGRGPVRSDPHRSHYDVIDLAPYLRGGSNVITATVRHFGVATSWWMPAPPTYSLGGGSFVLEALFDGEWLVTDETWRATPGAGWESVPVLGDVACLPIESFDGRRHPHLWESTTFDDGGWPAATVLPAVHTGGVMSPSPPSEPFGQLLPPVRTAMPGGARRSPVSVLVSGAGTVPEEIDPVARVLLAEAMSEVEEPAGALVTCDFGEVVAGTVELTFGQAAASIMIEAAASEHVNQDGGLVPLGQHAGFRCITDGVSGSFETLEVIGLRHLHLLVTGADALRTAGELEVAVNERHRPRPQGPSFACSDPTLTQIYEVGLRTVDLCATDAYIDCPTREQRAWTGDSVVHQMVDLVANHDRSLAMWHPQLAASPRADGMLAMAPASDFEADDRTMVPDWSLHWVRSLRNLWWWTERGDLVEELLPVAERTLRWFESSLGDDGLLHDVSGWLLLDWSSVYSRGTSSTLNALWARGLEDLAAMARWFGNDGTARWADERREGVRQGFDAFFDEERAVYVDHVVDGRPQRPASQHPGAAALAAGLVPADRFERVIERLLDRRRLVRHSFVMDPVTVDGDSSGYVHLVTGYPSPQWDVEDQTVECQPFFRYVLHDGLARAGRADVIAELCGDWSVFLDRGDRTWPECWQGGTRCHGWSSTPTRDLVVHVLGIKPASPGFTTVEIEPSLGSLEWARATVPTPAGPLTVSAWADGRLDVESPIPVVGREAL